MADLSDLTLPSVRASGRSGLLTTVVAVTATAGHLCSFRCPGPAPFSIRRVTWLWNTIAGFIAAQEIGQELYLARIASPHTGGSVVDSKVLGKQAVDPALLAECRIGATGELTAVGTPVLQGQPLESGSFSELAAAVTVHRGFVEGVYKPPKGRECIVRPGFGFILGNSVLMGAGGTGRLQFAVDYDVYSAT